MTSAIIAFALGVVGVIIMELLDISRENWNLKQQVKDSEDADRKEG